MRVLFRITLALLFAQLMTSLAFARLEDEKKIWYSCQQASDCTVEKSYCGDPIALNRQYLKDFKAWYATIRYRCSADHKPAKGPFQLSCKKNTCHAESK